MEDHIKHLKEKEEGNLTSGTTVHGGPEILFGKFGS